MNGQTSDRALCWAVGLLLGIPLAVFIVGAFLGAW